MSAVAVDALAFWQISTDATAALCIDCAAERKVCGLHCEAVRLLSLAEQETNGCHDCGQYADAHDFFSEPSE